MINLEFGNVQNASNAPIVPFGYMEMYLNTDATVLAPPYGQVLGGTVNFVRFYFDANANLITPVTIWSNAELNPQNTHGLGTWYVVNFYDQTGTKLNNAPMNWLFTQANGSTVDIGTLVNSSATGPYYPLAVVNSPILPENANTVYAGPTSGIPAFPTFRAIVAADLPVMVGDSGSGGVKGAVPAPAAGDAAAGKFLKADGTFQVPTGSSGITGTLTAGIYPIATGTTTVADGAIDYAITTAATLTMYSPHQLMIKGHEQTYLRSDGSVAVAAFGGALTLQGDGTVSGQGVFISASTGTIVLNSNSGAVTQGINSGIPGTLQFVQGTTPPSPIAHAIQISAPASVPSSYTAVLPSAQGVGALVNDGSGNLSWTPAGAGSVTSVAVTVPARQTVTGSPVTTSGTIAISDNTQAANLVFAGPTTGSVATPTFRSLVTADMPAGTGTVTGVAMTGDGTIFNSTVSGSPVTTSGTLAPALLTQTAKYVLAGPVSGSAAAPTFRQLSAGDLSNGVTGSGAVVLATAPTVTAITVGTGGSLSGVVTLAGGTSGTSTITGPAVAGTATNPITLSNAISIPSGTTYQINGTQISAANLSNGTTGSGSVVLAGSPTLTGTVTLPLTTAGLVTTTSGGVISSEANATIAQGGTGTGSTLTGLVRGSATAMTAAELSGDATTSGSNAVTVVKVNGGAIPLSAPVLASNASNQIIAATTTGSGAVVLTSSPALTTPAIGSGGFTLAGSGSGTQTIMTAATTSGTITLPAGSTDFSATGGTSRVLKQVSTGAAITVAQLAATDVTGVAQLIGSGTQALGTPTILSGNASTIITTAVAGVLASDNLMADFATDPSGVTGYAPSASGGLTIVKFCTAGNINFYLYNNSAGTITPGAMTLNYRVIR